MKPPSGAHYHATKLVIRHLGSDERYDLPLTWDAAGVAEHAWPIPAGAKLGSYEISISHPKRKTKEKVTVKANQTTSVSFSAE